MPWWYYVMLFVISAETGVITALWKHNHKLMRERRDRNDAEIAQIKKNVEGMAAEAERRTEILRKRWREKHRFEKPN